MKIDSFRFEKTENKTLEKFVMTCLEHKYNFEVFYVNGNAIVEVANISNDDYVAYCAFFEEDEEDDEECEDDYYEDSDNLEMGFNPYMGCYDYDC